MVPNSSAVIPMNLMSKNMTWKNFVASSPCGVPMMEGKMQVTRVGRALRLSDQGLWGITFPPSNKVGMVSIMTSIARMEARMPETA